jgi:hypothetical protein
VRQDPAAALGRAVAVGHDLGAAAGLRETHRLREVIGERHRWHAVRGHLQELDGDLPAAATAYAEAARRATNIAERDHLVPQAARARAAWGSSSSWPSRSADGSGPRPTPDQPERPDSRSESKSAYGTPLPLSDAGVPNAPSRRSSPDDARQHWRVRSDYRNR